MATRKLPFLVADCQKRFRQLLVMVGMKRKLSVEGALGSLIKKYFGKSEDSTRMLELRGVLSAYPRAVFLLVVILFGGSALYFFLTRQEVSGAVISGIGILLLGGNFFSKSGK